MTDRLYIDPHQTANKNYKITSQPSQVVYYKVKNHQDKTVCSAQTYDEALEYIETIIKDNFQKLPQNRARPFTRHDAVAGAYIPPPWVRFKILKVEEIEVFTESES